MKNKKLMWIRILLFCMLANQLEASWFKAQNVTTFFQNNQKSILAIAAAGAIAIPSYIFYKSYLKQTELLAKLKLENLTTDIRHENLSIDRIKWEIGQAQQFVESSQDYVERKKFFVGDNVEFKKFVEKFAPPEDLQRDLIAHEKEIYASPKTYNQQSERFFVKLNPGGWGNPEATYIERVINAERLRKIIQRRGFKYVDVPKKYVFLIGDFWAVIAEKVQETKLLPDSRYTLEQIQELAKVVEETGYSDFQDPNNLNIVRNAEGKFVFIDTENATFRETEKNCWTDKARSLSLLLPYIGGSATVNEDAEQWIKERVKELEELSIKNPLNKCLRLPAMKELDDEGIDMDVVKNYQWERVRWLHDYWYLFGNRNYFKQETKEEVLQHLNLKLQELQLQLTNLKNEKKSVERALLGWAKNPWKEMFWSLLGNNR